jgi:folate-dependent phosphoribosylglycinamide formyltransferase PurN
MGKVARGIQLSIAGAGLAALLAGCQNQLNEADRALLLSAQESARTAEAADAASSAQLAAERQDRMLQKTMRK